MDKNLKGLATETWVLKKLSRLNGAGSSVNVMSGDDSLRELFNSLFEKENVGTTDEPVWVIKAKLPLYSLGEISAFGRSSGEGGGGTGGGGTWGSITGTISNQSDLMLLLNAKQNIISDLADIRSNATHGNTAYNWGNHANAGYLTSSDLTSHTSNTTVHITANERTTWNGKQDVISDLETIRANANLIAELFEKVTDNGTSFIKAKYGLFSVSEISAFGRSSGEGGGGTGGGVWGSITGTISNQTDLIELLNAKQNTISDLSTIRANALNGATAYGWGNHANAGYLTSHQDISGKQDTISDLSTIRSNASNGATAYSWGNHASAGYAKQAAHNNLIADGNEFTFASSAFNGYIWLNYRTAGGLNGAITDYKFGDGKGGLLWNLSTIASNASNGNSAYTLLNDLFEKVLVDGKYVIKAKYALYSESEITAYGSGSGGGSTDSGGTSGGTSGGGSSSGGDSGSTGTASGSISGNNEITVSGVSGDYTLVYLDASGNELTDYEEITQ